MADLRQSSLYGKYMEAIGWKVVTVDRTNIFIKKLPLPPLSIIKVQRQNFPIPFEKIEKIAKKYRAFMISIEPGATKKFSKTRTSSLVSSQDSEKQVIKKLSEHGYKKSSSPYLPTKTIHIDLGQSEEKIFKNFSESKRRAVRKAIKNGVVIKESKDINSFIKLKASQFFPLGFLIKKDINALWQTFYPENAVLLLADKNMVLSSHPEFISGSPAIKSPKQVRNDALRPLAGILLLFHQKTAHYWLATSTKQGNKFFAPTLLVWATLKLAKKRGFKIFDFEGVYDPRFSQATRSWQGFTRFKKGFGGKEIEYPGCFVKSRFLF